MFTPPGDAKINFDGSVITRQKSSVGYIVCDSCGNILLAEGELLQNLFIFAAEFKGVVSGPNELFLRLSFKGVVNGMHRLLQHYPHTRNL